MGLSHVNQSIANLLCILMFNVFSSRPIRTSHPVHYTQKITANISGRFYRYVHYTRKTITTYSQNVYHFNLPLANQSIWPPEINNHVCLHAPPAYDNEDIGWH